MISSPDAAKNAPWLKRHPCLVAMFALLLSIIGFVVLVMTQSSIILQDPAKPLLPSSLPVTGDPEPGLAAFDSAMTEFMGARGIRAGALAVSRNGVLLLQRGYGWQEPELTTPIRPDTLFRLASVDKPVTAAAVKRLITQGLVRPEAPAFQLLGIAPDGPSPDVRLKAITIAHLLAHQAGWDNAQAGFDPCFDVIRIAGILDIAPPAETEDIARYMARQQLQFAPGSRSVYSNFGYALLRLIVERTSGRPFAQYLQQEMDMDVLRSHAFVKDRDTREAWYDDPGRCFNVYVPSERVPCADGGFAVEQRSIAASAGTLVRFLDRYWISGEPRSAGDTGYVYWFYGSLPGTFTFVYQRPDGINIAALFNQRTDSSGLPYDTIKSMLDRASESVVAWPDDP